MRTHLIHRPVTNRLSLTAGARYNLAKIVMADLLGTSPDINGNNTFSRLNPVVGLTYKRQMCLRCMSATVRLKNYLLVLRLVTRIDVSVVTAPIAIAFSLSSRLNARP
jgi:hypothetical protein